MHVGVDEAGKGPVLGSMFAAAVYADPATLPDGVGDSKAIPPERRETLAAEIRAVAAAVGVAEITVARIDDPETDMNSLTVAAHVEALASVADSLAQDCPCVVDAGDANAERFGRRVAEGLDCGVSMEARHGADETDPVVGAASIVAKVARDDHVASLAADYPDHVGRLGSGYPSDPTTRDFLRTYVEDQGELPDCARRSWQTCADVLAAADQSSLADF